jgi:hypothetical protein
LCERPWQARANLNIWRLTGVFWHILLTGGAVAGGLFAGLFLWRRNVVAPFAAHLALNLLEFLYIWLIWPQIGP